MANHAEVLKRKGHSSLKNKRDILLNTHRWETLEVGVGVRIVFYDLQFSGLQLQLAIGEFRSRSFQFMLWDMGSSLPIYGHNLLDLQEVKVIWFPDIAKKNVL
jgi:hypothetical protein